MSRKFIVPNPNGQVRYGGRRLYPIKRWFLKLGVRCQFDWSVSLAGYQMGPDWKKEDSIVDPRNTVLLCAHLVSLSASTERARLSAWARRALLSQRCISWGRTPQLLS